MLEVKINIFYVKGVPRKKTEGLFHSLQKPFKSSLIDAKYIKVCVNVIEARRVATTMLGGVSFFLYEKMECVKFIYEAYHLLIIVLH